MIDNTSGYSVADKEIDMAEVVPFRGVRYNPETIPDMAAVVAPPYDVISPSEQEGFYERHPNNVIRLILGKSEPNDDARNNVHTRAGRYFESWIAEKLLVPEKEPAFYMTTVSYKSGGQDHTRHAIIARVRLEPFEKGIVLPHERTFSKVKSERLMLMKECHANFSPIFGLYTGGKESLDRLQTISVQQAPTVSLVDGKGHEHKMWCLTDQDIVSHLTAFFRPKRLFIADGHHRYETALNYRDWVKANDPAFSDDHPANFVMMSLSSMVDPGMTILPAHRLLKEVPPDALSAFMDSAGEYFDIERFDLSHGTGAVQQQFEKALEENAGKSAIGFYMPSQSLLQVLVVKDGVMTRMFEDQLAPALRDLDVTVLTHLIMMELLGFDQARLDDATKITYRTTIADAIDAVDQGEAELAYILNPTKIEQVQRVAENGLIMPRKSTYFYPKVISGQVFNLLR